MASKPKTSPYDSTAVVKRVEDGVAWVQIPGGVDETPVKLTVNAEAGDTVQVRVSGGTAFLVGNSTAPPTDDKTARQAVERVQTVERRTKILTRAVQAVSRIAGNTRQYFWHTEEGTDTGVHITEIPQERFLADPENGGGNLLARSNGIAIRDGLTELATFGETVQIGLSEGNHVRLVGDAFSILDGDARQFSVEENRLRSFDEYGTEMFDIGAHSSSVGRVAISDVEDGIIFSDSASKTWSHTLHQVVSSLSAGSSFGLVCYLGYTRNGSGWTWDLGYDSYDAASTSKRRAHYNSQDFNFTKGTAQTKTRTYNTYYPDVVTVQAVYDGDKTVTFSATSVSNGIIAAAIQTERIVVNANMRRPSMSMGSSVYKPYSVALGEGLYANKNEVVLGKYNVDFYEALYALQIGGGTDFENPQDLFRVGVDGDIQFGIPNYVTSGTEDYTLYNLLASIGWGSTSSTNPVILDDDGTVV